MKRGDLLRLPILYSENVEQLNSGSLPWFKIKKLHNCGVYNTTRDSNGTQILEVVAFNSLRPSDDDGEDILERNGTDLNFSQRSPQIRTKHGVVVDNIYYYDLTNIPDREPPITHNGKIEIGGRLQIEVYDGLEFFLLKRNYYPILLNDLEPILKNSNFAYETIRLKPSETKTLQTIYLLNQTYLNRNND